MLPFFKYCGFGIKLKKIEHIMISWKGAKNSKSVDKISSICLLVEGHDTFNVIQFQETVSFSGNSFPASTGWCKTDFFTVFVLVFSLKIRKSPFSPNKP